MEILSEIIGWIGTVIIIIAYFLVSFKKVDANSRIYQTMNLFGAICVGINVFSNQAWPALFLQLIWGIIAISSLIKNRKR